MGSLFAPKITQRASPTPPTAADPAIAAARKVSTTATMSLYGRSATDKSSGTKQAPAAVAKKTLLGG